jgi:hypothetical protein
MTIKTEREKKVCVIGGCASNTSDYKIFSKMLKISNNK